MSEEIIKSLLGIGIQFLGSLIPSLGGLLGGPFGWIAGIAINWLTKILFTLIERRARFIKIDGDIADLVNQAKARTEILKRAQEDPNVSEADRAKAKESFRDAVRNLGRLRLQ